MPRERREIAPNIEAGNMMYKELAFMAGAQVAGLVMGARVPVILTSRADTPQARLFSYPHSNGVLQRLS